MARIAMFFGALLVILGIVLYSQSELEGLRKLTALIPAAIGLLLVLLGQIASGGSEKMRMHTMHAAAMLGLIGLIGGAVMAVRGAIALSSDSPPSKLALGGQAIMAVLCGVFVGLCVKSFIDVRRARKAASQPTTPPV